jgi:vitamin B12 transporter
MTNGRWTFTPGIRYDYNTISGSFISPSLGITYKFDESIVLRSSLSRGFTSPPLGFTSGSGLFVDPNPSLKPEKVISYQLGLESTLGSHFQIQTTLFYHDLKNEIKLILFGAGPPSFNDIFMNSGTIKRQGFEAKITTRPVFRTTVTAGTTYVHIDPAKSSGMSDLYTVDIGIKYDNQKSLRAQLFGHYIFWDYDQSNLTDYSDFIWDINLIKNFQLSEGKDIEFFFSIHNIFNGSQYTNDENRNPFRWAEAGVRFKYK